MGRYADRLKFKQMQEKLEGVISKTEDNGKIESLQEVLNFLQGISDSQTLPEVVEEAGGGGESATDEDIEHLFD